MQCSGESGSGWLHRLRASRGFPTDSSLDLEHFLNPPSSDLAAAPLAGEKNAAVAPDPAACEETPPDQPPGQDWYVLMTNVLSELFNMGGGDRSGHPRPSKVPRKQPRPRACAVSTSASVGDSCAAAVAAAAAAMSPSSAENSVAEEERESGKDGVEAPVGGAEEEISQMGIEDWEVGSYSKTTVTVIDTSEPLWRSEKVLFRKGDDWKICNRKGSSSHWSRKRRKLQNSEKGVGTNASARECKALLPNEVSF